MRTALGVAMAAVMAMAASHAFSPRPTPPLAATALPVQRMHFNTLARSSAGMVAGGELGTLLYSTDEGRNWQRARLSVERQALITQVRFDNAGRQGLAVGHEGWILHSDDGGLSWRELHFDKDQGEPLMSIAQLPAGRLLAVGAFGRMLRSDDDGRSWQRVELPGVEDKHLNRIVGNHDGSRWLVVGERGLVLQGDAQGEHWQVLQPFYNGSLYNAVALSGEEWLVYGMRGHVFRSSNGARQWHRSAVAAPASFFGHARSADGRLVLVGQGGLLAFSSDEGERFSLQHVGSSGTLTDAVSQGSRLWLAGEVGLHPHDNLGIRAERAVNGDLR